LSSLFFAQLCRPDNLLVHLNISDRFLESVLKLEHDLDVAAFVDLYFLDELKKHGAGEGIDVAVAFEVGDEVVFVGEAVGVFLCGFVETCDGFVQRLDFLADGRLELHVLLLRDDTLFPVGVQVGHHAHTLFPLGGVGFDGKGDVG